MKNSKFKIEVVWIDGQKDEFDVLNYELHETLLTLTRQIENQTSSFLAALTTEEKIGIPLSNVRMYSVKG